MLPDIFSWEDLKFYGSAFFLASFSDKTWYMYFATKLLS